MKYLYSVYVNMSVYDANPIKMNIRISNTVNTVGDFTMYI